MHPTRALVAFALLIVAACFADRPAAPGVFALGDMGPGRWRTVSTGADHSCALDVNGRAYCWGSNRYYQLGVSRTDSTCGPATVKFACSLVPLSVGTGRRFRSISAGSSHTCAISTDSVPFCWGNNHDAQSGPGAFTSPLPQVVGTSPMVAISAGSLHSCGLRPDSLVVCWGSNRSGALGAGNQSGLFPVIVSQTLKFIDVDATDEKTCALTAARRVMCWGALWVRTSGDTNYTRIRRTPELTAGVGSMVGIGAGFTSTCGIDATGFGWCWDSNIHGESGSGPGSGSLVPRRIHSDEELHAVSVGARHACGISVDGSALCWGSNSSGQLGFPTLETCGVEKIQCAPRPGLVAGQHRFTSISTGFGAHTCGITDQLNLYCWGAGSSGQRGDGTRVSRSHLPRLAAAVSQQ
jgi:alpha-tubulin suppressor-like RCC1 family protein